MTGSGVAASSVQPVGACQAVSVAVGAEVGVGAATLGVGVGGVDPTVAAGEEPVAIGLSDAVGAELNVEQAADIRATTSRVANGPRRRTVTYSLCNSATEGPALGSVFG